jgi:type IV pilus assembly protein PilM
MPAKEAWGLDIAKRAVRMVRVRRHGPETLITAFDSKALRSPPDDPDYEEKVSEAIEELVSELGVGRQPVYVGIPGPATFFRDLPLPSISAGNLDEIVSYEARQQIPYPLEEVLWDYHEQVGEEDSSEIYVSLVCCRRDIVSYRLEMLKELGLNVVGFQVGPVALANFILHDQPPEGTTLVLDAGAQATDFVVLRDSGFWLRSISTGGNDVTQALMRKFNLPFEEAEELKQKMGESKQADRVFQVIKPVLRSLGGEVQRSLGYYKSLYRGVQLSQALCTGGTFQLPGVTKFLGEEIGLPVKGLQEVQSLEFSEEADEDGFNQQRQAYAVATGLALQGVGQTELVLNLLPQEEKRRQLIRAKRPSAIGAVALLAAAAIVSLVTSAQRTDRWDGLIQEMARVVGSQGAVTNQKDQLQKARESVEPIRQRIRDLSEAATARGEVSAALETVYRVFEDLNAARKELADKELEDRAEDYFEDEAVQAQLEEIEGQATNYAEIVSSLKTQARLRAKQVTDRRRRVFIDRIEANHEEVTWFVQRAEEEEEPDKLFSPSAAARAQEGEDDLELEEVSVGVVMVKLSGFSVSKREELTRDITGTTSYSLATVFGSDIPGVHEVSLNREAFSTNTIYVPEYKFSTAMTPGGEEKGSTSQKWASISEETIPFEASLQYLPERFRQGYEVVEGDAGAVISTPGGTTGGATGRGDRGRGRRGR